MRTGPQREHSPGSLEAGSAPLRPECGPEQSLLHLPQQLSVPPSPQEFPFLCLADGVPDVNRDFQRS